MKIQYVSCDVPDFVVWIVSNMANKFFCFWDCVAPMRVKV